MFHHIQLATRTNMDALRNIENAWILMDMREWMLSLPIVVSTLIYISYHKVKLIYVIKSWSIYFSSSAFYLSLYSKIEYHNPQHIVMFAINMIIFINILRFKWDYVNVNEEAQNLLHGHVFIRSLTLWCLIIKPWSTSMSYGISECFFFLWLCSILRLWVLHWLY